MNKVVQNEMKRFCVLLFNVCCTSMLVTACQKSPPPEQVASAPVAEPVSSQPTGLVKNAIRHTEETADVTRWMDQASTKTAAQMALEEKQAKEAKEVKLAAEAKALAAKTALNSPRDSVKAVAASIAQTPAAVPKAVEIPVAPVVAVAPSKPVPIAEPVALKLISSVQPRFPKSAEKLGVTEGTVTARIHIETDGKVSGVDIIQAKPAKHFAPEVIAAASQWKYAPIASPQTKILEFNFKLDN
ncbi:TonB family protein [Undibacterium sp. Jales W-56]|uniref:energy transducer TonB n=1 Tax=Undibacterium sp. Jales W-56 TaxID=2897325 RepID=UPI0021D01A15|nr:energy transducer TonB [Undibacterium sp. Jales W-56]MCU6435455.1 TonB family protein [Undibacterium sp. Jales W-56]